METGSRSSAVRDLRTVGRNGRVQRRQRRVAVLSEVAGGVAHSFNNVVAIALGECHLLESRPFLPSDITASLERVRGYLLQTASAMRRLRRMLHVPVTTRPEAGEEADLDTVVRELVTFLRPIWREEGARRGAKVRVRLRLAARAKIHGRAEWLREVVAGLLLQAVDAMPAGGTIDVATGGEADSAWFAVSYGVPHPGLQAGVDDALPPCASLVERMAGHLEIERSARRGTTLRVRFDCGTQAA